MKKSVVWYEMIRRTVLLLLLALAGVMLALRPQTAAVEDQPAARTEAQAERSAREAGYEKDLETLRQLAQKEDGELAREQLNKMISSHQSELAIEEALRENGLEDALVIVQNGSVTVMATNFTKENSAGILALCMAHANVGAENVRLMNWEE